MNRSPRLQILGGVGTIGGTKVIVQEGEHRVLFDFGVAYVPGGDFWGGKLQTRPGEGRLRDLLALDAVPPLHGLYQHADAVGLEPVRDDRTQVFISHLHLDHMATVDLLADSVPVWMHADSLRLFRASAAVGERPAVPAGARAFQWGEAIRVGPLTVTPRAVDHDVPGASGLVIETSVGTVVYTGDLRTHGAHPEHIEAFVAAARAAKPKILLIEGTRLWDSEFAPDRPADRKETEVAPLVASQVRGAAGLAMITVYPRNTERIGALARAAREAGRTLALSPDVAHIFAALGGDLSEVAVYRRLRDRLDLEAGTPEPWLAALMESAPAVVDAAVVTSAQEQYLLQLTYADLGELVDLKPAPGSVFIHSNGEPLGRFDPVYDVFLRWLDRFGVKLVGAHSTGHASAADLQGIVAGINPEILMPIHSVHPERLSVEGIRRVLPSTGDVYDIATGELIG